MYIFIVQHNTEYQYYQTEKSNIIVISFAKNFKLRVIFNFATLFLSDFPLKYNSLVIFI